MSSAFVLNRDSELKSPTPPTKIMTMTGSGKSSGCCTCTKRKVLIAVITACVFTLLCYVLREKYFFRADVLVAISSRVDDTNIQQHDETIKTKDESSKEDDDSSDEGGVLSFFGLGGGKKKKNNKAKSGDGGDGEAGEKINVWDAWMKQNKHFTSIGDIYDKCGKDNWFDESHFMCANIFKITENYKKGELFLF